MRSQLVLRSGALMELKHNSMDERLFLFGQRVLTPSGEGEVVDTIGDKVVVKLDTGSTETFSADDVQDNNSAG